IETSVQSLSGRVATMQSEAETFRTTVAQKNAEVMQLKTRIDMINAKVERIGSAVAKYASFRQRLETRLSKMTSLKGRIEIAAATLEEKIKTNSYKTSANKQSMSALQSEIGTSRKKISDLAVQLDESRRRLDGIAGAIDELGVARSSLQKEVERSSILAARAGTLTMKFEERASVAKNAMSEDFAIADLMKDSEKFGIVDLVHDMIKWDREYERAVLAAGSEWMKAFVVDDVNSMILIAAYAKEKRLPRLKIIPLDVVGRYRPRPDMPNDDVTVLGRLSDFVYSDYDGKLPEFLFSDTILTRTSSSAYLLARQGYRSVSVDGELFEPAGGSVSLDFGGKISDFTDAILLGDSVETLRETIAKLSALIEKKNLQIREMSTRIADSEAEKVKLELVIENAESGLRAEQGMLVAKESSAAQVFATSDILQSEQSALTSELAKLQRRLSLIGSSIQSVASRMQGMSDESSSKNELATMNVERNQVIRSLDSATISLSQSAAMLGGIDSRLELESGQLAQLQDEKQRLLLELEQRKRQSEDLRLKSHSAETELKALRDQEQQVIDSSGNAYTVLQEYEQKIRALSDSERKKSKEHSLVEKESALLRKDVSDLAGEESRLTNDLVWLGYKNLLDAMDVAFMIKELSQEFEAVSKSINLRADESYVQVIDGYRSMSGRKNQLENERNSIVSFIQHIEKEKRDVFMEAFNRVDGDIRTTFERMTGGSAWLEIENQEDIFSSGVTFMVRFPNKTVARESTALSGGEKTIAATVFLLALQSLKPSPFYLMDEIDAHLDAQNTERLSKVLLERSKDNQIIMVTLKDATVAKAGLIYGIYPREGVSQLVRYKNPAQVPLANVSAGEATH
ncbi:MAG TPA: chromosome segregation SMC family protein, partial [Nitrososphaera sp.]|nr:chromosome segregation SMC family protein [Nitrososphaera sp.]